MKASASRHDELDGLRCLSVAGVLAVHFDPGRFASSPWADWGVRLFFVLSGFLITTGLLRQRRETSPGQALRDFFIRRGLRLWPLYFAVLAATWLADLPFARLWLPWNALFATNVQVYRQDLWPELLSHFWTLAVEQQFYLVWPFLLLFVAPRLSAATIGLLLVAAPLLRACEFAAFGSSSPRVTGILLPMCADYLAWGALLAFLRAGDRVPRCLARHGGIAGLALLVLLWWARVLPAPSVWRASLEVSLLGFASLLLVAHCVGPDDSLLRRFLRLRPLVYLGVISYGIYILHNFAHRLGPSLLRRLTGKNYFDSEFARVAWLTAISLLLACASWHLFEQPVMKLGRRLFFSSKAAPADATGVAPRPAPPVA